MIEQSLYNIEALLNKLVKNTEKPTQQIWIEKNNQIGGMVDAVLTAGLAFTVSETTIGVKVVIFNPAKGFGETVSTGTGPNYFVALHAAVQAL